MRFNYPSSNSNAPGIYKITNTHTQRVYVGQCKNFATRWSQHSSSVRNNKHQNKFIQNDFNKCKEELGNDDFLVFEVIEVMEGSTKEERTAREQVWIDTFYDKQEQCYNFKKVASPVDKTTWSNTPEETSRKLSVAVRNALETDPSYRAKLSEKSKLRWSEPGYKERLAKAQEDAWKGSKREGQREALSERTKKFHEEGRMNSWTDEQRQKMSEENQRRMQDPAYKETILEALKKNRELATKARLRLIPVIYGPDGTMYENIRGAIFFAREHNIPRTALGLLLSGKIKKTATGWSLTKE